MTGFSAIHRSEQGFVLVLALVMLILLTILGVWASQTSIFDVHIASNDRTHKKTFYEADSGTQLAERLLYANAVCTTTSGGFSSDRVGQLLRFSSKSFFDVHEDELKTEKEKAVSDTNYAIQYFPEGDLGDLGRPHTNILAYYTTKTSAGTGMLQLSGYEGFGVGSAGAQHRIYSIKSQHRGLQGSRSEISTHWRLSSSVLQTIGKPDCTKLAPYAQ